MNEETILARVARDHLRDRRFQQAQSLISAWQQRSSGATAPLALQGLYALMNSEIERAKNLAQEAVARDPSSALAYFSLAQVYLAEGRPDDGLTCAQKANQLDPSDAEAACLLAHLQSQVGQLDQAESLLRRSLQIKTDPITKLALAELLLNHSRGELGEVEQLAREAYTQSPHIPGAWALHGVVMANLGDIATARSRLEFALALDPDQPNFMLPLAQVALSEGGDVALEQAVSLARRAIALAPHETRARHLLADAMRMQRQYLAAIKVLADASNIFPSNPEIFLSLARSCLDIGKLDAANEALEKAQALSPNLAHSQALMVDLHMRRGDVRAAFMAFESLDEIDRSGVRRLATLQEVGAGQILGIMGRELSHYLAYARFFPMLKEKTPVAHLKIAVAPHFASLISRLPGVDEVSVEKQFGAHWLEPLQRLPALLQLSPDTLLFDAPYLHASPAAVSQARAERAAFDGPCALVDLGPNPDPILVRLLGHWLRQHGTSVVILTPVDVWQLQIDAGLNVIPLDSQDLEMVAGWTMVVDTILVGDVALAHLAGGLGATAHVFLSPGHDPIWGTDGTTSWYPSLRLHKEPVTGGWELVWATVEAGLNEYMPLGGAN